MKRFMIAVLMLGILTGCEIPNPAEEPKPDSKKTAQDAFCVMWTGKPCQ